MKELTIEAWGEQYNVKPSLGMYKVTDFMGKERNGLGITLDSDGEPFATLTVSFGEFIPIANAAYIDVNNCPWATQLLSTGMATDTGLTRASGFCRYPLWLFDAEFLRSLDEKLYDRYMAQYKEETP